MDNQKLERIIIIILLLVNLFLLGVVLSDKAETRRSRTETEEYLTEVLRSSGVTVGKNARLLQESPARCTLTRNLQQERRIVRGLLGGKYTSEDRGGNIMSYRSSRGQAVFRGSGVTEGMLNPGTIPVRSSAEKTVARLLRHMGISAEKREVGISETDGEAYAEYYCCCNGCPVYNAVLRIDFSGESPFLISGNRVFDDETASEGGEGMDSVSALLRFVELLRSGEFNCTTLEGFRPGYLVSVPVSGESTLTPVWRLETDGGVLLINAENGRVENGNA